MTRVEMLELARGNVEAHLDIPGADEMSPEELAEEMFNEVYTLAFDALHDAGVVRDEARSVATELAQMYAQP